MYVGRRFFTILFVLLINPPVVASQKSDDFLQIAGTSAALAIGACTVSLLLEQYEKSYLLPQCTSDFKGWASCQLAFNRCNLDLKQAQSIDFRADTFWRAHTFAISVDKADQEKIEDILVARKAGLRAISENELNEEANIKHRILHEYKHYKNGDLLKHHVLCAISASVMIQTHFLSRFFLSGLATCLTSIVYGRYQEIKANRYAFARMDTEGIEKVQAYMKKEAEKDESIIAEKMKSSTIRGLCTTIIYGVSLCVFRDLSEKQKRRMHYKIARFFFNGFRHPDWYTRAELGKN